jgi:hypothetical protein
LQGIRVDTFIKTANETIATEVGTAVKKEIPVDDADDVSAGTASDIVSAVSSDFEMNDEPFRLSTTFRPDDWTYVPGQEHVKLSYCPCTIRVLALAAAKAMATNSTPNPECFCSGGGKVLH